MMKIKHKRMIWLAAIVGLLITGLCIYFYQPAKQQSPSKYNIDKTGAGAVVDFTDGTKKVHAAVDAALLKEGIAPGSLNEMIKEVPRKNVEGIIRWHTRQLLITVPAETPVESLKEILKTAAHAAGGQVFSSQPDTYQGAAVVRIDIGLQDKLAEEDITIIDRKSVV